VKRISFNIILLFLVLSPTVAQSPSFYLGFDQILDNREYFTEYGYHQTIFGARINTGASFTFDSVHQIRAGLNYMYEYGGAFLGVTPQIDLYYSYRTERIDLFVGSFPRREQMDYPLMLLTDSLNYYRPNMEGASVRYNWDWGTVHGWIDWTGRETEVVRESILAGFDATLRAGSFYLKAIATRYHLARTTAANDTNKLRDDGSLVALLGTNLSEQSGFDRLDISSGWVSTYVQARPADYVWNQGWLTQLDVRKGIFGFRGSWFMGGPSPLLYGDRLYSHGDYGRFDFYIDPFHNSRISSKIGWNLHYLPGDGLYHSQQLLLTIML
jgi:hypothetical protein